MFRLTHKTTSITKQTLRFSERHLSKIHKIWFQERRQWKQESNTQSIKSLSIKYQKSETFIREEIRTYEIASDENLLRFLHCPHITPSHLNKACTDKNLTKEQRLHLLEKVAMEKWSVRKLQNFVRSYHSQERIHKRAKKSCMLLVIKLTEAITNLPETERQKIVESQDFLNLAALGTTDGRQ